MNDTFDAQLAECASRAMGAMFFFGFGGVWLLLGLLQLPGGITPTRWAELVVVAALTAALLLWARRQYTSLRARAGKVPDSPARRRARRIFHLVNVGQWIVIVVGANVLVNLGARDYTVSWVIAIVGLHFLPLAAVFRYPPHYLTGGLMVLDALATCFFPAWGPQAPAAPLTAGLVLWASAAWAIRPLVATGTGDAASA